MNEEQAIKYIDNMYQKRMDSVETKDGVICLRELKNVEFTDLEIAGLILLRHNHFKDNEITKLQQQLKDKDEKISKVKKAMTWYYENSRLWDCEMTYLNGVHNGMYSTYEEINEIFESNKED